MAKKRSSTKKRAETSSRKTVTQVAPARAPISSFPSAPEVAWSSPIDAEPPAPAPGEVWSSPIAAETAPAVPRATASSATEHPLGDTMDRLFSEASSWRAPTLDLAGNEGEITEEESPERQARRLRFRKLVAGVLGMAAVLALAVGLRAPRNQDFASLQGSLAASPEPPTALLHPDANQPVTTARTAEKPAPEPVVAPKEPAAREPVAEPAPKEPAAREPAAEPAPKEPAAAASAEAAAGTVAPDPTRAAPLTKRALAMLERGNNKGAIELADASIEADSTDANAYLYKGTALLELGQRAAAKEVFGRCVQQAKRGPIHECRAFR